MNNNLYPEYKENYLIDCIWIIFQNIKIIFLMNKKIINNIKIIFVLHFIIIIIRYNIDELNLIIVNKYYN